MINIKKRLLGLVTSAVMAFGLFPQLPAKPVTAADVSSLTAKEISQQMGAGWNLGNTLEATGGSGLSSETSWGNPKATKQIFEAIKAKGFTTVRIPVTWGNHLISGNTIDPAWFERVHTVVDWAMDEGLFVILNMHHEDKGAGDPHGWLTPKSSEYNTVSTKFKALWKQIATEFSYYDKHLIFEGMNEPRDKGGIHEWDGGDSSMRSTINKLNADFVSTVRATGGNNKTRALMVPTYAASNTYAAMNALSLPEDSNLIVSVHAYTPYQFAMNGYKTFDTNMENQLNSFFNDLDNCFVKKGIPVCIGEFGTSNYNNSTERAKWAKSFASSAKNRKVPIVIWDNNVLTSSSSPNDCYGLLDRDTYQWHSAVNALVKNIISVYGGTETAYTPDFGYDGSVQIKGSNWWAETTVTKSELLSGIDASKAESVTFSSNIEFTLFYGSTRVDKVSEHTIAVSDLPATMRIAVSANDNKMKTIGWIVNMKADPNVPTFSISGANGRSYGTTFKAGDKKLTINIPNGCTGFKDLGGITYSENAPTVRIAAIIVNDTFLVPVGKELIGSDKTANVLASVKGEGGINGRIYGITNEGFFGFFGNGGTRIAFRPGQDDYPVTKLDYILTDEVTPDLLGAEQYEQFSAIDSDGIYSQRHIVLVRRNLILAAKNHTDEYTSGRISRRITSSNYYYSLTVNGQKETAPDGYVFLVTQLDRIKDNFYPQKTSDGKTGGLTVKTVFKL